MYTFKCKQKAQIVMSTMLNANKPNSVKPPVKASVPAVKAVVPKALAVKTMIQHPVASVPKGKEEIVVKDVAKIKTGHEKVDKRVKNKTARALRGKGFERMLMKMDPYGASLHDPWGIRGARIPDLDTRESTTKTAVFRRTVKANANGVCGMVLGLGVRRVTAVYETTGSLMPVKNGDYSGALSNQVGVLIDGATADTNDIFDSVGASLNGGTPITADAFGALAPILFNEGRITSAGMRVSYIGSWQEMQGKYNLLSVPRNTYRSLLDANGSGVLGLDVLSSHPLYEAVGIPKSTDCMAVVHYPIDELDRLYSNLDFTYTSASIPDSARGSEMYAIVDGAIEGQSFLFECILNFECQQKNTQLFDSSTGPSIADSFAMDHAANSMANLPNVKVMPGPVASKLDKMETHELANIAPVTQKPMFDQVLEGISKVVDKGMEIGGKLTPFLEAML